MAWRFEENFEEVNRNWQPCSLPLFWHTGNFWLLWLPTAQHWQPHLLFLLIKGERKWQFCCTKTFQHMIKYIYIPSKWMLSGNILESFCLYVCLCLFVCLPLFKIFEILCHKLLQICCHCIETLLIHWSIGHCIKVLHDAVFNYLLPMVWGFLSLNLNFFVKLPVSVKSPAGV